jgi:murein DD-endopeptidase MepM/ murein hydrolase activator NlpD
MVFYIFPVNQDIIEHMKRRAWTIILIGISLFCYSFVAYTLVANRDVVTIRLAEIFENAALPFRIAKLTAMEPDIELRIPMQGIEKRKIADTWGEPRPGGRSHEGVDIFAKRGTPVFSATEGYVLRRGYGELGGNYVYVIGKGGVRYYYAHLDSFSENIDIGTKVTLDTVLGYVGTTGNASGTPPHLHFGMYKDGAQNPYGLLVER